MVRSSRRDAAIRLPALLAALAALAWALAPGEAAGAEAPVTAAVLPVDLAGTNDPDGELTRAVRDAVGEHLALVPSARINAIQVPEIDGRCVKPACVRSLAATTGARWVIRSDVSADGSDYDLEVTFADGRTGEARATTRTRCTACGWAEVAPRLSELAREGWRQASLLPEIEPARPSPAPRAAPPPRPHHPGHTGSGLAVGKWVATGVAVGLIAASAVLFAYDGRGTCDLPADAAGLRCPRRYETTLGAGLLLGGGALAAGAAATLFVLDARRRPRVVPTVQLAPHGFALGVGASF